MTPESFDSSPRHCVTPRPAQDEDGNGVITKGELTRILRANHMASCDAEVARKADTIMQQADKDGDGVVTFDEFVIVSKKFPNILFPAYSSSK